MVPEKEDAKDTRQAALSWEQNRSPIWVLEHKRNSKNYLKAVSSILFN